VFALGATQRALALTPNLIPRKQFVFEALEFSTHVLLEQFD
jgi:hypothetical protein